MVLQIAILKSLILVLACLHNRGQNGAVLLMEVCKSRNPEVAGSFFKKKDPTHHPSLAHQGTLFETPARGDDTSFNTRQASSSICSCQNKAGSELSAPCGRDYPSYSSAASLVWRHQRPVLSLNRRSCLRQSKRAAADRELAAIGGDKLASFPVTRRSSKTDPTHCTTKVDTK